jgi:uncharacterized repeat protein (TIGR01451 family)/CSLREA domain-containing protein
MRALRQSGSASGGVALRVLVACAIALVVGVVPATSSHAQFPGPAFVVDSTGDQPDFSPGDGSCSTSPIFPTCTLRAAIQESNFHPGTDTIRFASGMSTISPTTALPESLDTVQIDGNNGFGRTSVEGSSIVGPPADGLVVRASGTFIENLALKGFGGSGVRLEAPATLTGNLLFLNGGAGIVVGVAGGGLFGNVVAQNTGPGIRVLAGPITISGNSVTQNGGAGIEIVSGSDVDVSGGGFVDNGGLGIDLDGDGVTPNDPGDTDTGTNGLQNFPVLTSATTTGTRPDTGRQVVVQGTIDTTGLVRIRLYGGDACDASGNGEGASFLGEQTSVAPGPFTITLSGVNLAGGSIVTATATDAGGSTSEFSKCVSAVLVGADLGAAKTASPGAGPGEFVTAGNEVRFAATISNAGPDPATNVTLLDLLPHPSFATLVSATLSQGTCAPPNSNGEMPCQLGTIAVGATATIDVRMTVTFNSSINLENGIFSLDADETDPECTLEPAEPGQTTDPPCDGAVAVTHVEPADGTQAGGFVGPGDTVSTGTTASASDPTVVSLTNNGATGTEATLSEVDCTGSPDPLCSDPNIVGDTLADVSTGGTSAFAAAAPSAPTQPAPYTVTLVYDRSILPTTRLQAFHVYSGSILLAGCSRKISAPCVSGTKVLSGSKDLQVKVSLTGSAKLRTTTS